MKFSQLTFWLVIGIFVCTACGENKITQDAKARNANQANTTVSATASPTATTPNLDVPYVPTHEMIVDEMLKMGEVKGSDVLYDLGSGDGRIPITAAKRLGTRGVGIDLNPVRIQEANANAAKASMTDKVKFIEGDIFKQDFGEATVLTLYLLPDVNLKLRDKILQMKPGTRVVSHNYDMGDWKPEKVKELKTPDDVTHYVYMWRVPEPKK